MNWLRICANRGLFTVVDPADFFEWKVSGTIPKGTRFSKDMPPSQIFAQGLIVATADLSPGVLKIAEDDRKMLETKDDTGADIQYYVGAALSPVEVLEKYHRLKRDFAKNLEAFKKTIMSQQFIINPLDHKIYRIAEKNQKAEVYEYDSFPEIQKQLIS